MLSVRCYTWVAKTPKISTPFRVIRNPQVKRNTTISEKQQGVIMDQLLEFEKHIYITVKKIRGISTMLISEFTYKCTA